MDCRDYNIGFTLGKGNETRIMHMTSNHSASEIESAYEDATRKIGWDYVKSFGLNGSRVISANEVGALIAAGVFIDPDSIIPEEESSEGFEAGGIFVSDTDEFIWIFEDIIKIILPDFYLLEGTLDEQPLYLLEGEAEILLHQEK